MSTTNSCIRLEVGKKYVCRNRPNISFVKIVDIYNSKEVRGEIDTGLKSLWYLNGKLWETIESSYDLVAEYHGTSPVVAPVDEAWSYPPLRPDFQIIESEFIPIGVAYAVADDGAWASINKGDAGWHYRYGLPFPSDIRQWYALAEYQLQADKSVTTQPVESDVQDMRGNDSENLRAHSGDCDCGAIKANAIGHSNWCASNSRCPLFGGCI